MRYGVYETVVDLGRGGMADLYVARPDPPQVGESLVILKTLRPPITDKRIEMFLDEARLGLLFDHPNVVRTFGVGEEDGRHFIAMELLDGQPLDRVVKQLLSRSPAEQVRPLLLWVLAETLAGLHYAHDLAADGAPLHIVHRDFTPQNLFVTYDGRVKALDFGIAKSAGRISRTTTGEIKGKVRYMAPEQALGLRIDRRADVFAAGIILYELLSGAPFWRPEIPDREVFDELVGGGYPVSIAGIAPSLNTVLAKALARDASERFRSAEEMRVAILAEIPPDDYAARTAALMSDLFADQRDRTTKMVERALADKRVEPAPVISITSAHRARDAVNAERATTFRRLLARFGLSMLIVLASTSAAKAEPEGTKAQPESTEAEQHFKRGLKLFDDGDYKLALVEFERSYDLSPNFRVLYNIGEVQFQLNRYASSKRTLERYLEVGGERVLPNRRAEVERDLDALKIRTAHLRVNVDVVDAEILVDGERIGRAPLKDAELVDAGAHKIVVQKQGYIASNEALTLVGGDEKSIDVHLTPVPPKDERPIITEVHESSSLGPVWIGWGLTAAFGIATVGSIVAWQSADGKLTDLKSSQSSSTERESQARTVDTMRTLTFVAGGATLVTAGVSLFFTLRRGESKSKTAFDVGPSGASFRTVF